MFVISESLKSDWINKNYLFDQYIFVLFLCGIFGYEGLKSIKLSNKGFKKKVANYSSLLIYFALISTAIAKLFIFFIKEYEIGINIIFRNKYTYNNISVSIEQVNRIFMNSHLAFFAVFGPLLLTIFIAFLLESGLFLFKSLLNDERARERSRHLIELLVTSIFLSLYLYSVSILLGSYTTIKNGFEMTFQLTFFNFAFDFFTIFVTLTLVKRMLKSKRATTIISLVISDVLAASIFAILSIYLGLLFTEDHKTILECASILAGFNDNTFSEDGYLFFLMHTTFFPTVLYLSTIIFLFICKIIVSNAKFFLIPNNSSRPYALVRSIFLLLLSMSSLIYILRTY